MPTTRDRRTHDRQSYRPASYGHKGASGRCIPMPIESGFHTFINQHVDSHETESQGRHAHASGRGSNRRRDPSARIDVRDVSRGDPVQERVSRALPYINGSAERSVPAEPSGTDEPGFRSRRQTSSETELITSIRSGMPLRTLSSARRLISSRAAHSTTRAIRFLMVFMLLPSCLSSPLFCSEDRAGEVRHRQYLARRRYTSERYAAAEC